MDGKQSVSVVQYMQLSLVSSVWARAVLDSSCSLVWLFEKSFVFHSPVSLPQLWAIKEAYAEEVPSLLITGATALIQISMDVHTSTMRNKVGQLFYTQLMLHHSYR